MHSVLWRRAFFLVYLHSVALLKYSDARPNVLISGLEALPDDDLGPIESAPEPVISLNVGTAPYASDILHDGVASQRFDDTAVVPKGFVGRLTSNHIGQSYAQSLKRTWSSSILLKKAAPIAHSAFGRHRKDLHAKGKRQVLQRLGVGPGDARAQLKECHDAKESVMVESGMRSTPDVVMSGLATSSWSAFGTGPSASLQAPDHVLAFAVYFAEGTGLATPTVGVSDQDVLAVELAEKGDVGETSAATALSKPVVLVAQHFCKRPGIATVSVELPMFIKKTHDTDTGLVFCAASASPVVFAYKKICAAGGIASNGNSQLHDQRHVSSGSLSEQVAIDTHVYNLLHAKTSHRGTPWEGIIPNGGIRFFVLALLLLGVSVMVFEFGTLWVNVQIKNALAEVGPNVFGVKTSLGHIRLSLACGEFSYIMHDWVFHNPEGAYDGPYLMKISEAKVWLNLRGMICSCFRSVEVYDLKIKGLHAEVEVDGYVMGQPNVMIIQRKLQQNNLEWKQNLDRIKDDYSHIGIDPHAIVAGVSQRFRRILSRLTLKEVEISDISYKLSTKMGGFHVALADVQFHDFTAHHHSEGRDAVGLMNIGYYLGHEILALLASDIVGMDIDHGRFANMVSSAKQTLGITT